MTVLSIRRLLAWTTLVLALQAFLDSTNAEDRALLVGINQYLHLDRSEQLSASVNDARLMERLAREQWSFKPGQIKLLLDEEATADGIRQAFDTWLVGGTQPGDRVFFYYSGHGYFVPDEDGDEPDGKDEILVAHDAHATPAGLQNVISDDEIAAQLKKLEGRGVMVIADSCHSGTITRALDPEGLQGPAIEKFPSWRPVTRGGGNDEGDKAASINVTEQEFDRVRRGDGFFHKTSGMVAWTAVSPSEIAQEDMTGEGDRRNSVFTRRFVDGIRSGAADGDRNGTVSAAELLRHVRAKARAYCASHRCKTGMTPTFEPGESELARDMSIWSRGDEPVAVANNSAGTTPSAPPQPPTAIVPVGESELAVKVEMLPGAVSKLGEETKLRVSSAKPGYLIVLDVRDDGRVVQLFPSVCAHSERMLRADAPLTLPDPTYGCAFTATEAGKGKIMAIVSQDNIALDALLGRHKDLGVVASPSAYLGEIAEALLAVWTGDARNRPVKWGLATVDYEIK